MQLSTFGSQIMSRDTTAEVFARSQTTYNQPSTSTTTSMFIGQYGTPTEHYEAQRSTQSHPSHSCSLLTQAGLQPPKNSYTYYSPLSLPSHNSCSPYSIPTPPLTGPIPPLRFI